MKRTENFTSKEQQQKYYELGQFGMYNILKDLDKQGLYLQPIIIGMLDNLIAATLTKVGNDKLALKLIETITSSYLADKNTKH